MSETDFRKQNVLQLAEHELSDDQLERLIENKFNRAMTYYNAFNKQEELQEQD